MLNYHAQYAAGRFITRLIVCFAVLLAANTVLSRSRAYGAANAWNGSQCLLSLQLQQSPYREAYIAKLATAVGSYYALNENSTELSDADDDISLFSFGRTSSNDHQTDNVDAFSRDCLSCHDGTAASDISVDYRNSAGISRGRRHVSGGKDHPIGMDYASYVAFGGNRYKNLPVLNSKMILVNGRVGCLTCHNPFNPEPNHLVMSDFRSALCLTCHNK